MSNNIALPWLKGVTTPDQKKEREELIRNSVRISELLLSILADKYSMIEKKGFKEEDYSTAGWQTLQAFRNGKMAALEEIAELFQHIPDKGR